MSWLASCLEAALPPKSSYGVHFRLWKLYSIILTCPKLWAFLQLELCVSEFLNQLNNEATSLDDRLLMGYGALISPDFPLQGKEQVIIDWMSDCLRTNVLRRKLAVKTLLKMLSTEHLLTISETIDASKIIEVSSKYKSRLS